MQRIRLMLCYLFFHKLVVLREFKKYGNSRLVYCLRCKKHFGMHDSTKSFVPWNAELEAMYREQGEL